MESEKREKALKITSKVLGTVIFVAVMCWMFTISVSTGIAAIVFWVLGCCAGYLDGYRNRTSKILEKFLNAMRDNEELLLAGKTLNLSATDDSIQVSIVESEKKETKKKKETK